MIIEKQLINLPAEKVLWMVYVKKFDPIKLKYKVKLRFDSKFIFFEAANNALLKQAVSEAEKIGTQEYELRFLLKDSKLIYNYHLYIKMIKSQEYKELTNQFDGLCIMVKDKFIKLQNELAENAGYRGDISIQLPNSYVLAWMPHNKADYIMQELNKLLNTFSHLRITDSQAIWFSCYKDSFQKTHNCAIEYAEQNQIIELRLASQSGINLTEFASSALSKNSLIHFPFELDEISFNADEVETLVKEQLNCKFELWSQVKVIDLASQIDKKYGTNIQNRIKKITKLFRKSFYIYGRPENESKVTQILRTILEQRIKQCQDSIVKDYLISSEESGFKLIFFNRKGTLQLVNNVFDPNDFDQFLAQNYNLPYEVKVYKADKNLSFYVKVPNNQREIKNVIVEMLDSYVNHSFYYIVDNVNINFRVGHKFNCKIETFKSNSNVRGLLDIYGFELQQIEQNNNGDALVIKVSNILHSKQLDLINYFNQQLQNCIESYKSDIYLQMVNDNNNKMKLKKTDNAQIDYTNTCEPQLERCKIIQLTSSQLQLIKQFNIVYNIIKQSDQYLEDSFFVAVQYKGNQLQDAIESIKSQESQFLAKWAQDKEIIEVEKNKKYELYSVFIQELFLDYYSTTRLQLLNSYLDQEITMEKQQVQFYIEVTKLNVPISNLAPIITVIQSIDNVGRVFTQMKELPPGRYLIGYALTNAKEFQLSSVKYIIRNVVQIHQEDI
ncbi:unnamed protein product (macronuclear) [Paramecium tetraurelia]|uniref:Uncharacterized protein n=1 Tax=Paramecium tetraurelia TaxID=5888 RepID=A0BKI3_PARTE|nr:uncharacterized protein GSPATT00029681001 [Paramecium tetraurelia]CAK59050.1 unnamed protein product [Paramecium tetraurelia]|eukprot:XP_001426448.1 hypothetical protein (macronuclear) [Paramecium tetraurelia strain d4-2]